MKVEFKFAIQLNVFEHVVCDMAAIMSGGGGGG